MNCELKELKEKINLIENLEIAPVDEDTWHKICLTPVRYETDLILAIAKATFPEGKNFIRYPNEIKFTLNGFDIELPTSVNTGIMIDLSWFKPDYKKPPKIYRRFENMKKYFELLDNNNYTWYDLAYCRCDSSEIKNNKFKLFMWWFLKRNGIKLIVKCWKICLDMKMNIFKKY